MLRLSVRMLQLPVLVLVLVGLVWTVNERIAGENGVYIVSMTADPDERVDMGLLINGKYSGLMAYGVDGAIGGLTVAVPLRKGDRLSYYTSGESEAATHLEINLACYNTRYFRTIRSDGSSISGPRKKVEFRHWISAEGVWKSLIFPISSIQVGKTGMYWVMARPDCDEGYAHLDVAGLFTAYCGDDNALSASGAFQLKVREPLYMRWSAGHTVESATILSYVLLDNNEGVAFTAMGDARGYNGYNRVAFNGRRMTDTGNITYNKKTRKWTMPTKGRYLVAVRGSPHGGTTVYKLYRNDETQPLFTYWTERSVRSGQSAGFDLDAGDVLKIITDGDRTIDQRQMLSIAMLRPL